MVASSEMSWRAWKVLRLWKFCKLWNDGMRYDGGSVKMRKL